MTVRIREAVAADLSKIEDLLRDADLTTAGVGEQLSGFLVGEVAGEVIAAAGLEIYGPSTLLRSVAVRPDYRQRGLASLLVRQLLDRAHQVGAHAVYLLTTNAEGYFSRFGFTPIDRGAVDPPVTRSAEFGDACCATAQTMRLVVGDERENVQRS